MTIAKNKNGCNSIHLNKLESKDFKNRKIVMKRIDSTKGIFYIELKMTKARIKQ